VTPKFFGSSPPGEDAVGGQVLDRLAEVVDGHPRRLVGRFAEIQVERRHAASGMHTGPLYRRPNKVASRVLLYVVASGGKNAVRFHSDVLFEPDTL
jgi:hypothetical protein